MEMSSRVLQHGKSRKLDLGSFPIFRLFRIATKFWWIRYSFYAVSNGMFFFELFKVIFSIYLRRNPKSGAVRKSEKTLDYFQKKFENEFCLVFWLVLTSWNQFSFVNISRMSVIHTSMERSSRVIQHRNPKIEFHKIKVAKARKNSSVRRHFPRLYIGVA